MSNDFLFIFILVVHWIADFILQSDEDAKGKSVYMKNLVSHTGAYSIFWIAPLMIYGMIFSWSNPRIIPHYFHMVFDFVIITFILHTITDYFTSRLNARLWQQEKRHEFFIAIGFDQILHYLQLWFTFKLLHF